MSCSPLMVVAIFLFIQSWNDFMWLLFLTNTEATQTLPWDWPPRWLAR